MTATPDWGSTTEYDDIGGDVAIVGIGETAYTKASGRTAREIGAEAAERAIADAGLEPEDIDGLTYSGAFPDFDVAAFHEHFGTSHDLWVSPVGRRHDVGRDRAVPRRRARSRAGKARHVLNVFPVAWATQRSSMTGGPGEVHAAQSAKQNLEVPFGWFPQPVYFATIMRRHMLEFGTTEEQFGAVAVACRRHANLNPDAVMHDKPMTLADYLASPMLADPLRLFDSCLISDGGAAYVTTSIERARDLPQPTGRRPGRRRRALGQRHALEPAARRSRARRRCSPRRARSRWPASTPADVDVLTVYDPFTVVSLMQIEDMGFCPKGDAGAFVEGDTLFHDAGRLPFNTHGGLLSHAYVLGIAHVVELVKQLRGTAAAQVPDCEVAVYGGYTGAHASTLVLTGDR